MGYQESYVTANNKKDFLRIVKRIQELGHGFYDSYGTYPVEIITFNEYHDYFRKGQQAIYFVGERYLQNELGGRLLGYTDEFYEDMSDEEMDKHIEEELSFHLIKYYTEDIDASGIWEDAGEPMTDEMLHSLIGRYATAITCFCFMGGDSEPSEVERIARLIKKTYPYLKTAWYSGKEAVPEDFDICTMDFIKTGPYIAELGGLKSPTTNQTLYKITSEGSLIRISMA